MTPPKDQGPPRTTYVHSEGGYVAYQVFGQGPSNVLFVTSWLQNLDVMWEEPSLARYLDRLASFSRVICVDKRGSGVSDPVPLSALPTIEDWMDDIRVVLDATGIDPVVVIGDAEGGPLGIALAASLPERVRGLILVNSFARWKRAFDYPIGMPAETIDRLVDRYEQHWGVTSEILGLTAPSVAHDQAFREWFVRYQRLSMPRGASTAMYRWVTSVDVRALLPAVNVPTLVLHRVSSPHYRLDFGRYLAESIARARLVEIPGADAFPFHAGDTRQILDEIELFVTGALPDRTTTRRLATVMFTDIVGSTAQAVDQGDAQWMSVMERHDVMVREQLRLHRGREVNYTGDGFVAIFDGPGRAVACAQRLHDALRETGLNIRAGVHTGEVEVVGDQIAGLAVVIAARVMAAAVDGGVFVSSTVKDLVLGSGISFADRGAHSLKGVPGQWHLFEVESLPG